MTGETGIRSLVTIHDVTREVLPQTARLLERIGCAGPGPVILLVVPGGFPDQEAVEELRALLHADVQLAGHGLHHRAGPGKSLYHRLHSLLISRQAAEHLSRPPHEVARIIASCAAWFDRHRFAMPDLYVPPAWAPGRVSPHQLAASPFRFFENQRGLLDTDSGVHYPLPLLGFEADTAWRARFLKAWNQVSRIRARRSGIVRIAIHPHDLQLRLHADLERDIARYPRRIGCRELVMAASRNLH